MESKSLLIGIASFIAGAFLVSVAATTFDKPEPAADSMSAMVDAMQDKTGDEFDEAFLAGMIVHHEGAVEMAQLSEQRAKHEEIKNLSQEIISAQEKEIAQMKQWQRDWGYDPEAMMHGSH